MTTTDDGPTDEPDDAVRWLNPAERRAWVALLALVSRLPGALDAQLQHDAGLSLFEYSVLAVLSEQAGATMHMSDLAFLAQGSQSRLSHVASQLERQGLLRREPCPEDGRYTNAVLTDHGHDTVAAAAPAHLTFARTTVIDRLTPTQLDYLRQASYAILSHIDPGGPWKVRE